MRGGAAAPDVVVVDEIVVDEAADVSAFQAYGSQQDARRITAYRPGTVHKQQRT